MGDITESSGSRKGDYLYLTIYRELKNDILQGGYKKGDLFPPERVLKDRFGTTHVTVRNALSLLVEEGYIERYSGKGTVVVFSGDSVEERVARVSVAGIVQFIVSEMDRFHLKLVEELSRECISRNLNLQVCVYNRDHNLEKILIKKALDKKELLLIHEPSVEFIYEGDYEAASDRILLLNPPVSGSGLTSINQNFTQGCRDSVAFLNSLGYKEIAFIGWERNYRGDKLLEGYKQELSSLQLPAPGTLQANGMGLREGGYDACTRILKAHPSCRAFLCANDLSAGGVLNRLKEVGIYSKDDYTVIGCGNHPFSEVLGISSLDFNTSRIGQIFRSFLAEYCEQGEIGKAVYEVSTELIIRKYNRI